MRNNNKLMNPTNQQISNGKNQQNVLSKYLTQQYDLVF